MSSPQSISLVLATHNRHKVKEIKAILKKAGRSKIRVLTLDHFPHIKPIKEDLPTLEGNASKKARAVARATGQLALADDTGLFVPALRGKPGVRSARFAGPKCDYADNCRKLLRLMRGKPLSKRKAIFRCVAALATSTGRVFLAQGRVRGKITFAPRGKNGFGYDPVFFVPKYGKTFAEMPSRLKNGISHRYQAFVKVPRLLKKVHSIRYRGS
ncbi:MAG: RdgB/HAM1 family non-canonical purine NTP pyrophosphatase [Elusimicrobia bacterium]|nr:RdgB/HAM1 family non-canonical purine NTP pyrophosphatase [Candidatus Obscuribacterium magneticum]